MSLTHGDLTNIPAGTYTLTVTDANQCSATLPEVDTTEPADLLLMLKNLI